MNNLALPKTRDKFRILHLIAGLDTGGAEMMLLKLLSRMDRTRFDSMVVSLTSNGTLLESFKSLGIPVYSLGMSRGGVPSPVTLYRLIRLGRQLQPNLIQGWMYHGNFASQLMNAFLPKPVPVLWSIHHSIKNLAFEKRLTAGLIRLSARLSKRPEKIHYVAKSSAGQHKELGFSAKNNVIIPNGYDTDRFVPSEQSRIQIRKELGLPATTPIIGHLARFHPMKDHANFIQAAGFLSQSFPDVHYVLAGQNVDSENKVLKDLVDKLNLSEKIHLLGLRKDVPQIMAALDIFANSSRFGESFPIVIGEAMSCGVPCVSTDLGDTAWLIGDTGKIVPIEDHKALAGAWKDLLDLGCEGRKALGEKARERIINNFSLGKIVSQYEMLYKDVLTANSLNPDL